MKTQIDRGTVILTASVVAALAACVTLVLLPQQREIGRLQEDSRQKQDFLARLGNLAAVLQATQEELDRTIAYNAAWTERSPDQQELTKLFGEISALSKAAGTTTTRFDPEPNVLYASTRKTPLAVGVRGSYAQVHTFLASLEGLPEAIWVKGLDLEEDGGDENAVRAEVKMAIFADNLNDSGQVDQSE